MGNLSYSFMNYYFNPAKALQSEVCALLWGLCAWLNTRNSSNNMQSSIYSVCHMAHASCVNNKQGIGMQVMTLVQLELTGTTGYDWTDLKKLSKAP